MENRYRHVGVQKNLNFTRHTLTDQSSQDPFSCIMRLQTENRDLRADVETYKHKCAKYQENLRELDRWYPRQRLFLAPPSSSNGPSASVPYPNPELANHPKWRMRNPMPEHRSRPADAQEPDFPPIEFLPLCTPSSSESTSTVPRRRTPEPSSHRVKTRGDVPGSKVQPYGTPQRGRRRGYTEPTNGRRHRDFPRGPASVDRREPAGDPIPSNSLVTIEPEASGTSLIDRMNVTGAQDCDEASDGGR
ncbi:hypothetical protein JVU11DRAFT_797 [Chiua virens]|nr:hypothetical protein JVU11DRAFT_797 [Chiua virens]